MEKERLRDRFRGTLLGVAVGDALGAPFEGMSMVRDASLERLEIEPGLLRYTDDTHMTVGMAESLLDRQGFDGEHLAKTFARNYNQEPWRGYGAGPPQVFRLLEDGLVPWDKAGHALFGGAGSFGNGAAMRVAPAALAYYRDPQRMAFVAAQTALITHSHALGIEGAVIQACAIAHLLKCQSSTPFNTAVFLEHIARFITSMEYRQKTEKIAELLPAAPASRVVQELGHGIAAHEAVPSALFAFLKNHDSFPQAVLYAISLGGDTDTIASMSGALAGAYLGELSIPLRWRQKVEKADYIRNLADGLLDLALRIALNR